MIEIDAVSKGYGERVLVDRYSRLFTKDDRIGIIGPNGTGKTTFLDMMAGKTQPDSGTIEFGPTVVVWYFDQ